MKRKHLTHSQEPLETLEDATEWIRSLHRAGDLFHLDDPPEEVMNSEGRLFSDEQAHQVAARQAEMWALYNAAGLDPHLECLRLDSGFDSRARVLRIEDRLHWFDMVAEVPSDHPAASAEFYEDESGGFVDGESGLSLEERTPLPEGWTRLVFRDFSSITTEEAVMRLRDLECDLARVSVRD